MPTTMLVAHSKSAFLSRFVHRCWCSPSTSDANSTTLIGYGRCTLQQQPQCTQPAFASSRSRPALGCSPADELQRPGRGNLPESAGRHMTTGTWSRAICVTPFLFPSLISAVARK